MRHCRQRRAALLIGVLIALPANAGPQSRHVPVATTTKQPRIVNVYTRSDRIFVAGHNLPTGDGLEARLGDVYLDVLHASATLLVARLPALPLDQHHELVVRRGVRVAKARGSAATWGFVLPLP
jgi:hypothetical protein